MGAYPPELIDHGAKTKADEESVPAGAGVAQSHSERKPDGPVNVANEPDQCDRAASTAGLNLPSEFRRVEFPKTLPFGEELISNSLWRKTATPATATDRV